MSDNERPALVEALLQARFKDLEPLARALGINPMRYGPKVQLALAISQVLIPKSTADTATARSDAADSIAYMAGAIGGTEALDRLLNSVHPECVIKSMRFIDTSFHVWLEWPTLMSGPILGTGSTRDGAIRNAVANALTALTSPIEQESTDASD